jgi:hypothetical protein
LNDEWLAQFKITSVYDSNVKLFSVPKECRPGGYFLKIISEDDFYTFKKNKGHNLENFNYFGDRDLAALKSRNLKDSKKYVYDLVKWSIKQYIKQKNSEIISKLNEL